MNSSLKKEKDVTVFLIAWRKIWKVIHKIKTLINGIIVPILKIIEF
jgi:hypothetical protein